MLKKTFICIRDNERAGLRITTTEKPENMYLMVLAVILCAISLEVSSSSTARMAQPTTGGGSELENKYGRERCLSRSMRGLGPTV